MVEHYVHLSNTLNLSYNLPLMTKQAIKRSAHKHDGYSTPALNDQLYLHKKGCNRQRRITW